MLQNIDLEQLDLLKKQDPAFAKTIDTLLANHNQIVRTISHELRNPLTLIGSSLQLLSSKYPDVKDFRHWNSTMSELTYMRCLLEDLTSIQSNNRTYLNPSLVNMMDFTYQIIESFAPLLSGSSINFTFHVSDDLPILSIDQVKLHEVFSNLLRNAMDAIDNQGSIHLSITQEQLDDQAYCVATISDNGCGIPPEHLETIFQLYTTYKIGGSGIGLALSRTIVEAHKGSLTVESTLHEGTTFYIRLPIQEDC